MSKLKKGMKIWLRCQIKPGPYASERRVYIRTDQSEWFGFVDLTDLHEDENLVRAAVIKVGPGDPITVGIRGHSPAYDVIEGSRSALIPDYGAVAS